MKRKILVRRKSYNKCNCCNAIIMPDEPLYVLKRDGWGKEVFLRSGCVNNKGEINE